MSSTHDLHHTHTERQGERYRRGVLVRMQRSSMSRSLQSKHSSQMVVPTVRFLAMTPTCSQRRVTQ